MIKSIVIMRCFILSAIQGSWIVLTLTLSTTSIDKNLELRMAGLCLGGALDRCIDTYAWP
jgi:hypothetical protein